MFTLAVRSPGFLPPSAAGWLFENHYLVWLGLVALGAILIVTARSRGEARMLRAGQAVLVITLAWLMAARWFETPAERLYAVHLAMAQAAAKADVDGLLSHFDQNFTSASLEIGRGDANEAIKAQIAARIKQIGIKEINFRQYEPTLNSDATAFTLISALTTSDMGPFTTQWRLSWNDRPDSDWRLQNATLLKVGDVAVSPSEVIK